jgi:hypothetical protein
MLKAKQNCSGPKRKTLCAREAAAIDYLRLLILARKRPLRSRPRFISWSARSSFSWLDLLYRRPMGWRLRKFWGRHLPLKLAARPTVPTSFTALRVARQALILLVLAACATQRSDLAPPSQQMSVVSGSSTVIYVVRRAWHVDIGLLAQDLEPPLASLRDDFPGAQYLRFGFGDRHYLLARGRGLSLLAALWPGPGILLVTGLPAVPHLASSRDQVIRIELTREQTTALQAFVWNSFSTHEGKATPVEAGPYVGSIYYETPQGYSALHTCNTWAAEALKSAKLPIRSAGVALAGQLWHQVKHLPSAPAESPEAARACENLTACKVGDNHPDIPNSCPSPGSKVTWCRPDIPPWSVQGGRRPGL